ncbi:MAG: RraA family protein [Firmicutes bacterium]|nr:RraA family protein [Alicyclobacillaceae bacterium]MCL6496102.1 RraA family protein [Bacillota bacterium]
MASIPERLARLDSCAVSDALDRLGMKGATYGIRPLWEGARVVGRVQTVKVKPVGLEPAREHLGLAAIMQAQPGDVIVVDNGGRIDVSTWGGLLALSAQSRGINGVIIDGACRDLDEFRTMKFPVFARGGVPMTARGRVMQQAVNVEIACGGVLVSPGDWVIADASGVVFIPAAKAEEVLAAAEAVAEREARMAEAIRQGVPPDQALGGYEGMLRRD